ncbi:MAG: penicillin-binding protein 2 [Elusimicrobiota bacterium]|jgi:cell division protein FtsI (penicillin-binding protein 3)|nr:penicillin-binding protein 2 [Elusimicrobiota bacterium]
MLNKKDPNNIRIKKVYFFVFLIFAVLILRLAYIQIINHSKIDRIVSRMVSREGIVQAKRGDILDSTGRVLAASAHRYKLFINLRQVTDFQAVKKVLAENGIFIEQKSPKDFNGAVYILIKQNLQEEIVRKIKDKKVDGIVFEDGYTRQYPEGAMVAHILGYVGSDDKGLSGIEFSFNDYLAGKDVRLKQTRDGKGNIISDKIIDRAEIGGEDVRLTIDMKIQFIVEQELKKAFLINKAKHAACIVQDPKTGEILAMVSLPDFLPTEKISDVALLRNYAISDTFEPGSTFKIVAISAALNEKKIKSDDLFFLENGRLKIPGHPPINDDPNHKTLGNASVKTIMAYSSNIGLVKIAQKLEKRLFYEYIRKFGFYSLSAIDLPGESRGSLRDLREWDNVTILPYLSFGQGLSATAIQIVGAFSVIANGGVLMRPVLIKSIGSKDYSELYGQRQIRRVISPETAAEVRDMLKGVVDFGTGKSAKVPGYTVGGKTGTGQKYDSALKRYSNQKYTASFVGMIPAMDPKVVIFVMFDEPTGDYYAASIAAPVFKRIAERIAQYLNIPKDDI